MDFNSPAERCAADPLRPAVVDRQYGEMKIQKSELVVATSNRFFLGKKGNDLGVSVQLSEAFEPLGRP
jgi:hypothetical protein